MATCVDKQTYQARNTLRRILCVCLIFMLTGYALYFAALEVSPPSWAIAVVKMSAPTLKALSSAGQIANLRGQNPFPIQVIILYCAGGSLLLSGWCMHQCYFDERRRGAWIGFAEERLIQQRITRTKLIVIGLATTSIWLFFPTILFVHSPASMSWQAKAFFSPTISSATFLLFAVNVNVLAVWGGLPLYFGLTNRAAKLKMETDHG